MTSSTSSPAGPQQTYLNPAQAAAWLQTKTGQTVTVRTLRRWRSEGKHGIKLQSLKMGRYPMTSEDWLIEFLQRSTAAAEADSRVKAQPRPPLQTAAEKTAEMKRKGLL